MFVSRFSVSSSYRQVKLFSDRSDVTQNLLWLKYVNLRIVWLLINHDIYNAINQFILGHQL